MPSEMLDLSSEILISLLQCLNESLKKASYIIKSLWSGWKKE